MEKKKTSHAADMAVIKTGNFEKIEAAIKAYAFDQETQISLIKNNVWEILELYMSLRKLGKQTITFLLSAPQGKYSKKLIKDAVIGNVLSEHNECLLIERYQELIEPYLKANPNGNYFSSEAVENKAKEAGLGHLVERYPRPVFNKPASQSLGGIFTPEMLAKLGV